MTELIVDETWKAVEGFEGIYEVSDQGRVRSRWVVGGAPPSKLGNKWKVLSGSRHKLGYVAVSLRHTDGRQEKPWVHRLVAKAFCHQDEGKNEVRHMDGNPRNNRAENLKWGTHAENQSDIVRHKSCLFGDKAPGTKITNKQAIGIVKLYDLGGFTYRYLAKQFGVCPMTIGRIVCGTKWSMITGLEKKVKQ